MSEQKPPSADETEPLDYRLSHMAPDKGESYQATFSHNPYRRMMWEFEKEILDDVRKTNFEGRELRHLDFACGTGRILGHFAAWAGVSVGVDISAGMLSVARKVLPRTELIEADITERDVLEDRRFNLITAFRFFANAQPALRHEALQVLMKHMDPDGLFVFNNHMNTASLRYKLARLLKRGGDTGMTPREVHDLLTFGGLGIVKTYGYGFTPAGEEHTFFPIALLRRVEKMLAKCSPIRGLGENQVFVCQKKYRGLPEG